MNAIRMFAAAASVATLLLVIDFSSAQRPRVKSSPADLQAKKARWSKIPLDLQFPDPKQFLKKNAAADDAVAKVDWTKFISPETINREIEMIAAEAETDVKNPGLFASKGFEAAELNHYLLAFMYHVASEHPGVKWKAKAKGMRALAAAAAMAAPLKDQAGFDACKASIAAARAVIKGGAVKTPAGKDKVVLAEDVVTINALMQRLETGQRKRLRPWTTDQNAFAANLDSMVHESEV
ncbi:MAG: hypothetical protein N2C14_04230, partial [Planctomycetales bacterium]